MTDGIAPCWLAWAREIQALAQTGRHYAENEYQLARNQRLTEIATEMIGAGSGLPPEPLTQLFEAQDGYATPWVDVRAAVFGARARRRRLDHARRLGRTALSGQRTHLRHILDAFAAAADPAFTTVFD
jgi:hypothetical protein